MHQRNTLNRVERQPTECGKMFTNHIPDKGLTSRIDIQQHMRRGDDSTHRHHQMVKTKIRLIIVFAAKNGKALYSQQKQDWELTVTQIINSLLPNSHLN